MERAAELCGASEQRLDGQRGPSSSRTARWSALTIEQPHGSMVSADLGSQRPEPAGAQRGERYLVDKSLEAFKACEMSGKQGSSSNTESTTNQ
ncbi:hypothetical protein CesoFtcFv8_005736 [Champsocephalus esox]|uniref:Uncharacterized protein n=1 Tax=Champsocephalus esox TaxID=159716 RepID=A0AAN8CIC8_9TELE|nr:hypothetical protein CesoFtcFv8_005736 [Champsocephalus esox]